MKFPKELIVRVDASLSQSKTAQLPLDGLDEIAAVALGLAKGDRNVARALILNDFEDWVAHTGRLNSSYTFSSYPHLCEGKQKANHFSALAWAYLLPARPRPTPHYA